MFWEKNNLQAYLVMEKAKGLPLHLFVKCKELTIHKIKSIAY
jgi:hypothetical protein